MSNDTLWQILTVIGWFMLVAALVAAIGLALIYRRIRAIRVPAGADFFTTLRHVPLALVVLLDLLDFGLDVFSAPISWLVLERMGLPALRNKAAIEALIPFTGPIPTFTLAWLAVRAFKLGSDGVVQGLDPVRPQLGD